jgi:hypothetical protein
MNVSCISFSSITISGVIWIIVCSEMISRQLLDVTFHRNLRHDSKRLLYSSAQVIANTRAACKIVTLLSR